MTYLASGRDPLNELQWISRTKRLPFVAKIPEDQNWSQFRMAIVRQLEDQRGTHERILRILSSFI